MTPETPIRAAIYLRISLDPEMDGLAIERQREDCVKLAKREGWTPIEPHYVDQSVSAYDMSKKRAGYDALVADYKAGKFDVIVCWDLDRLTRQPRQLEDWIDLSATRGLRIATVSGEADLHTEPGMITAGIKVQIARAEMLRKSKRQSAAQRQRAKLGRAPKGMRPLGYTVKGELIRSEANLVRAIYRAFAPVDPEKPSHSLRAIAAALSGAPDAPRIRGIQKTTPHRRTVMQERNVLRKAEGKKLRQVPEERPWSASTVLGILRNPRYVGWSTYTPKETLANGDRRRSWRASILMDDAGSPVKGLWKPIVDVANWQAAQDKLDLTERVTNRTGSTARKHIGSGIYLCGECNAPIRAHATSYRCAGCGLVRRRNLVDAYVVSAVAARLARDDVKELLVAADAPRARALMALMEVERSKVARAQRDYDAEVIEGADLKRVRDAARVRIAELEAERLQLTVGAGTAAVLSAKDPKLAWASLYQLQDDPIEVVTPSEHLPTVRAVINTLFEVRLHRHPRGHKGIGSPGRETVKITPRVGNPD